MARLVRRLALVALAVLLVAAVVFVVTGRSRLDDDRDRVEEIWTSQVRAPLADRYQRLTDVVVQLQEADAGDRDVTEGLADALDQWNELRQESDADVVAEAEAANRLEGLAARVGASIARSPRLAAAQPLTDAFTAFGQIAPPAPAVTAYNDAAASYQDTRQELRYQVTARVFGYDAVPTLLLGT